MAVLVGIISVLLVLTFGIAQIVAGYQGIEHHLGSFCAIAAIILTLFMRFTLPITIGSFFGAMNVWGWEWYWALLFASPGLMFILPGTLLSFFESLKKK